VIILGKFGAQSGQMGEGLTRSAALVSRFSLPTVDYQLLTVNWTSNRNSAELEFVVTYRKRRAVTFSNRRKTAFSGNRASIVFFPDSDAASEVVR